MRSYFRLIWILQTTSIVLISNFLLTNAQNNFKNNESVKKKKLVEMIIEEKWKESNWTNNIKLTKTYDANSNCISAIKEIWNGREWEKESCEKSSYDKLHRKVSNELFKLNKKKDDWELMKGTHDVIDTVNNKSNRIVLSDAVWDPDKKKWSADDSVLYDKKGRVIKNVNIDTAISDYGNDTLITIETSEYNYQSDIIWIETNKKWRSDNRKTELEKYRYRQITCSPMQYYTIDYWDEKMNRWVTNTAKLFRKNTDSVEIDSIEEIIEDVSVPVYVSSKIKDRDGNILMNRYWRKSKDENTGKWEGKYFKWERNYNDKQNKFVIAESLFVINTNGTNWKLKNYQNEICKIPSAGNIVESGIFENKINMWSFERSFDTLTSSGIALIGEEYFDEEKKKWMPMLRINSTKNSDSTVITTERLNDNGEWNNDSMFVVRQDKDGNVLSRINYVWTKTGIFSENWVKASRHTYIYTKE